jgi:hypothetical protein
VSRRPAVRPPEIAAVGRQVRRPREREHVDHATRPGVDLGDGRVADVGDIDAAGIGSERDRVAAHDDVVDDLVGRGVDDRDRVRVDDDRWMPWRAGPGREHDSGSDADRDRGHDRNKRPATAPSRRRRR